MTRPQGLFRRVLLAGALLATLAVVAWWVTPWPSVWVIRAIFDRGARDTASALEKHLPAGLQLREAVHYDPAEADALLDVYRPVDLPAAAPTIVWFHGGAFVSGRRGDVASYLKILAGRGYATVNVDYSISPSARYPTPIRQGAGALAFLDRHADELGINRNAWVLAGDSAGAQIAAELANLITSVDYARKVGIPAPLSAAQLKGALLYCGVYDIEQLGSSGGAVMAWFVHTVTWSYSGRRDWRKAAGIERMSVARYVTPEFPPTLITAGNADPLESQSTQMLRALQALRVPVQGFFFPHDHRPPLGHEYQFNLDGQDGREALARSVSWLQQLPAGP
ncbi:MAG: alpha/beta hydrolase [Proteobacteria bacterium]|nr:alpha/beta hydrolase [Pseudomonadota bacterium]